MNKNFVITIVLAILVLISLVQALQLNSLKSQLAEGGFSIGTASTKTPVASSSGSGGGDSLPSSLDNLPTMVGGC